MKILKIILFIVIVFSILETQAQETADKNVHHKFAVGVNSGVSRLFLTYAFTSSDVLHHFSYLNSYGFDLNYQLRTKGKFGWLFNMGYGVLGTREYTIEGESKNKVFDYYSRMVNVRSGFALNYKKYSFTLMTGISYSLGYKVIRIENKEVVMNRNTGHMYAGLLGFDKSIQITVKRVIMEMKNNTQIATSFGMEGYYEMNSVNCFLGFNYIF
jgi:hypothetical protein